MKKIQILLTVIFCLTSIFAYSEEIRLGTTFSQKQAEYLSQNWEKVYLEVLDAGFKVIRLGAYWNEIEKTEGNYDFTILDWQIAEAKKRKIPVLLTVGMKAPRWPEYFIPEWVLEKERPSFGKNVAKYPYVREKVLLFVKKVVTHYRNERAVKYWQAENEPFDRAGPQYWWIDKKLLKDEIEVIRKIDTNKRPIVINVATYPNNALYFIARFSAPTTPITDALSLCDILGLNIYPTVGQKFFGLKFYFWTHPWERMNYFRRVVKKAKKNGKRIWVTELQAEPWEPGELVHTDEKGPVTTWPEMMETALHEILLLGIDTVLLWGCEYWIYRKASFRDKSWWDKARGILKNTPSH